MRAQHQVTELPRTTRTRGERSNVHPRDELTYEQLVLIAGGHTAFQLLCAAVELGVFAFLSRNPGAGASEVANAAGLEEQPARILLTGLVALKLIVRDEGCLWNSEWVDRLLSPDSPENMIEVLGWQKHIVYPGEVDFVESLRQNRNVGLGEFKGEGATLYERLAQDRLREQIFQDAMSSLSGSANTMLTNLVDLGGVSHLVDAGGGDGTNAIAIARANPHLEITVFDSPSVCARAKANIEAAGLSDRIHAHAGNFFFDPFPPGADCILFSHILTIWSKEKNVALLKRAHAALPPGGRVLVFNMMANDAENGPLATALGSPYFLSIASGEGMLYSWSDYEEILDDAGFGRSERMILPRDHGVLVGTR